MDPVSISVAAALAAGAAAGAKDVTTTAIKDAYASLKRLIGTRYRGVEPLVDMVEADPSSEPEQQVLAKQLSQAGAGSDAELKASAEQLLNALESLSREPKATALFDFQRLRAAKNFRLEDVETIGTVLRAKHADFEGDFEAKGIRQTPSAGITSEKH